MQDRISLMSNKLDRSSFENFLTSLGFASDFITILSELGKIPESAGKAAAGYSGFMTIMSGADFAMNYSNRSTAEKTIAGMDVVVNFVATKGGLPGAGISLMYNSTKLMAPYIFQGINEYTKQSMKTFYNAQAQAQNPVLSIYYHLIYGKLF